MKEKTFIRWLITEFKIFNQYIEETPIKYRTKNKLEKIQIAFMQSINTIIENAELNKIEKEHLLKAMLNRGEVMKEILIGIYLFISGFALGYYVKIRLHNYFKNQTIE